MGASKTQLESTKAARMAAGSHSSENVRGRFPFRETQTMTRDMTEAQFRAACKRHGFKPQGFLGYYNLPGTSTQVSVLNAGSNRRNQLAYLISEQTKLAEANQG